MRVWIPRDARKYKGVYEMWSEEPHTDKDKSCTMWWYGEGYVMTLSEERAEKLLGHKLDYGTCECITIGRIK